MQNREMFHPLRVLNTFFCFFAFERPCVSEVPFFCCFLMIFFGGYVMVCVIVCHIIVCGLCKRLQS